jgi:chemotaxis protein histidine kinase CheA
MTDLQRIFALIERTRRRIRLQVFLEWSTTALVPATAAALVVLWLWRMERLTGTGSLAILGFLVASVVATGLFGALRKLPTSLVASRLDRASGLSDRLGTACEFAAQLEGGPGQNHPQTVALMQAAIADAERHVAKADPQAAAPFRLPRDTRAAGAFLVVAIAVTSLAFAPEHDAVDPGFALRDATARQSAADAEREKNALDPDDLDYSRDYVKELANLADQTHDPALKEFADALEELIAKAEKGEISKEELLAKMEALEKKYMDGSDTDVDAMLADMKDSGKELQKEPLTKRLGEALAAGDMEAAAKELERLGEQLEKKELTPEQEKRLADSLEKAAAKHEEKQKKEDEQQKKDEEQAKKDIQKKKDEIRRLEKKQQDHPKDEQAKKQLEKKKRELDQLERDQKDKQEKQANKKERKLDKLSRDMKRGAENLKNQKSEQAQNDMKEASKDAKGVEDEVRKVENQKRAQSQLGDLKDSLRRAKAKNQKGQGQGGKGGQRLARIKEWEQRAGGGQGNPQAWKSGQGKEQGLGKGQGQGQDKGEKGQGGDQGQGIGDQADPNSLNGDPTKLSGAKKDEKLEGAQGRGPSKRETILTAAQKGFASRGYKQVYADYKKVVEETMSAEKVPQGYKYYVKRYFQRIKPHSMD